MHIRVEMKVNIFLGTHGVENDHVREMRIPFGISKPSLA